MRYGKFLTLIVLLAFFLPFTYGGCSGPGSDFFDDLKDGGGDSCDGPVPCLTSDWGEAYREFEDNEGDQVAALSDGIETAVVFLMEDEFGDIYLAGLVGPVISCRNADLIDGAVDWDGSGFFDPEEHFDSVAGKLYICGNNLSIYDLVIEGEMWADYDGTYVGIGPTSQEKTELQEKTESSGDLLQELIQLNSGSRRLYLF